MLKPIRKTITYIILTLIIITAAQGQANDTDTSPVGVSLTSKTLVDITPDSLTWLGMSPGSVGDGTSEVNNYHKIQITNIGTKNITHIWFNATYPKASPFAVGSAKETNSGNYILLSKDTQTKNYYFINRVEYGEPNTLVYLTDPDGNMPPNSTKYLYGRFRNASNEYFWFINKEDGNCTDNLFYIGDDAHTSVKTGSTDFSNCIAGLNNTPGTGVDSCRMGTLTENNAYGYSEINIGGQKYCATVSQHCNRTFFSHWNMDYPFNNCGGNHTEFAWNTSNGSDGDGYLVPGEYFNMSIRIHVPYGIYEGASTKGKLTVLVNSI